MNYNRIYEYRFSGVNQQKKQIIWNEIAKFIFRKLKKPVRILDPAGGQCEFINMVPAGERWTVDMNDSIKKFAAPDVKVLIGNNLEVELPENYFDAIFISNFLEHLKSQEEVAFFLERMFSFLKSGGKICVMGPNFKYVSRNYFDFADHTVILTELGLAEHLYGAGFTINEMHARFLPLSFRGKLPVNKWLAKIYLNSPVIWPFFGKQFLLIAEKK